MKNCGENQSLNHSVLQIQIIKIGVKADAPFKSKKGQIMVRNYD